METGGLQRFTILVMRLMKHQIGNQVLVLVSAGRLRWALLVLILHGGWMQNQNESFVSTSHWGLSYDQNDV